MLHSRPAFVGEIIFAAILATLVVWMSGYSPVLFLSDAAANFASPFKIVKRLSRPSNATDVAWSPDGLKLATLSEYGTIVTIWDASDWQIVRMVRY
jgi:WD40 repeat protein